MDRKFQYFIKECPVCGHLADCVDMPANRKYTTYCVGPITFYADTQKVLDQRKQRFVGPKFHEPIKMVMAYDHKTPSEKETILRDKKDGHTIHTLGPETTEGFIERALEIAKVR